MPVRVVCLGHDELSELCKKVPKELFADSRWFATFLCFLSVETSIGTIFTEAMNLVDDITSTAESDRGSSGQGDDWPTIGPMDSKEGVALPGPMFELL